MMFLASCLLLLSAVLSFTNQFQYEGCFDEYIWDFSVPPNARRNNQCKHEWERCVCSYAYWRWKITVLPAPSLDWLRCVSISKTKNYFSISVLEYKFLKCTQCVNRGHLSDITSHSTNSRSSVTADGERFGLCGIS